MRLPPVSRRTLHRLAARGLMLVAAAASLATSQTASPPQWRVDTTLQGEHFDLAPEGPGVERTFTVHLSAPTVAAGPLEGVVWLSACYCLRTPGQPPFSGEECLGRTGQTLAAALRLEPAMGSPPFPDGGTGTEGRTTGGQPGCVTAQLDAKEAYATCLADQPCALPLTVTFQQQSDAGLVMNVKEWSLDVDVRGPGTREPPGATVTVTGP